MAYSSTRKLRPCPPSRSIDCDGRFTNTAHSHSLPHASYSHLLCSTDSHGNVNIAELKQKAEEHSKNLAALMITYPSTHGVYEEGVDEICRVIHKHGGQVRQVSQVSLFTHPFVSLVSSYCLLSSVRPPSQHPACGNQHACLF